ncbi:MAG: ATP-binding cassette domain-containing protein [Alkalibacterium sp.]|uniref:ABC-F family ATP-binding cassette domain-containing protein n=1 Tax=Alkalibacterium TaxID=99906 RepID=UPI002648F0BC|nr:ATP-binding cassette domain-containing protein [Alkalibacterium sp.]MDN6293827.1 ATP-binding cassette domain-containing protein [Alkalibacterium sp.]MDN6296301.1 ATP-binding cassette domain-containing protein [Alkalibacterium sp.]MDN6398653.1 ATP-binding cassette domain-containing protein [Alkalibacterium sp.]
MITVTDVSLRFSDKKLFEDVSLKFTNDNCYGVIGANGAGKSTFLKILSGEISPTSGDVSMPSDSRMAVLKQNHYDYEDQRVVDTVIMGHERLYNVMQEKNDIYMKADFSDEDGIRVAELEGEFAELNGWEAEPEAMTLLKGLGIPEDLHDQKMSELTGGQHVKVLLAQALFGKPDVLLLDEPTNGLDTHSIAWLQEFLINFENTVIVVSHDRHFLNKVCTHMVDVDFGQIKLFVGNYDFWLESSQLASKLAADQNSKKEEKIKELEAFIARFSANASKSKQATSRKKMLDKITLDDIKPSSRRYPFVGFSPEREIGNDLLRVENISKTIDGKKVLGNISFNLSREDKVAFTSMSDIAITTLFKIITGEMEPDTGTYQWGITTKQSYLPKDTTDEFENSHLTILDWLRQYVVNKEENDNTFLRSFLGRMLFSGEEVMKEVSVLSGGEKVRCMLSKLMLSKANVLILDDPTNHLDLESITALNNGLIDFKGAILFGSHDHQFIQTLANRIIEISPNGVVDRSEITYDEFLENKSAQEQITALYQS